MTDTSSGSRAGRNLPAAIASSLVLGALVLVSLFTQKWLFVVVVVAALVIASRELISAFQGAGIRIARTPVYAAAVILPSVAYIWGTTLQLVVLGVSVLLSMLWRIRRGFEGYVKDTAATIFTIVYLPFMAGFLMLTLAAGDGPVRVVVFILLTMGNDVGGYAVGVLFGRHPIAKDISPKKSWEGLAGSFVVQAVVGALTFTYLLDAAWWQGVIVGLALTVTATAGDFAESALKRDLGVKDMGSLLPGHGGMMDRLDSLVPNAFASWALFTLFLGSGISS